MNINTLILDAFWVSSKPFPTALTPNLGDGRAFYDYYDGPARYLGWMDMVLLKEIIKKHHIKHIILQNLDTLGKIAQVTKDIKVCVSYENHNFIIPSLEHFTKIRKSSSQKLEFSHSRPIYHSVECGGWELSDDDTIVPARAQLYMRYLLINTGVNSITYLNNKIKFTAHFDVLGNVIFETEANS